jgi:hypothetical protein
VNKDLIEYFWDERESTAFFTYEDDRTGEITQVDKHRAMKTPVVTEETRASYFANLQFWLQTQPLYD